MDFHIQHFTVCALRPTCQKCSSNLSCPICVKTNIVEENNFEDIPSWFFIARLKKFGRWCGPGGRILWWAGCWGSSWWWAPQGSGAQANHLMPSLIFFKTINYLHKNIFVSAISKIIIYSVFLKFTAQKSFKESNPKMLQITDSVRNTD